MTTDKDLYDVVVFNKKTRKVTVVAGRGLKLAGTRNSVAARLAIVVPRLNAEHSAVATVAGRYMNGSTLRTTD